mmetsp:Transcript_7844/g.19932  ORF Transcript_7844/g.19932 Transcript_7844/m.19932 type:complete len:379 (-) Transcript_7844:393-1529(-)
MLHDGVAHRHGGAVRPRWDAVGALPRMASELRERGQGDPELVHEPVDGLGALVRQRGHATKVRAATLCADVGVALEVPTIVVHAVRFLDPCAAGVDARGRLCRVAAQVALLLDQRHLRLRLRRLDGRAHPGEASADDDDVRLFVKRVSVLPVLRHLRARLLQAHDARPQARVEQVVADRILEAGAPEGIQEPPALAHVACRHGGSGQRIRQHAAAADHRGAGDAVAGDLDGRAFARIDDVGEAGCQGLEVVAGGGHGLAIAQLDVSDVLLLPVARQLGPDLVGFGGFEDSRGPISARRVSAHSLNVTSPVDIARLETCILQPLGHLVDSPAFGEAAEIQLRAGMRLFQAFVGELEGGPLTVGGDLRQPLAAVLLDVLG